MTAFRTTRSLPCQIGWGLLWLLGTALPCRTHAQPLSPERAVELAAAQNPSLRAALADVAAAREAVLAQQSARGPVLVAHASGQRSENMVATGQGVSRTEGQTLGADVAVQYTTDIGTALEAGASSDVSWRSANVTPDRATTLDLGPNPAAALHLRARQPLLRGAGRDVVLAGLRQARANRSEAERTRDEAASVLVRDVLGAYWELWYAQRAMAVQDAALEVARAQHRDARIRSEELGTAPRTEALRFASELAAVSDSHAQARETLRNRALELGRLLGLDPSEPPAQVDGAEPPLPAAAGDTTPGGPPDSAEPTGPSLNALLEQAHGSCAELRALAAGVEAARERVHAAADDDQARLDVTTTLSTTALWADDALPGLDLPGDRPAWTAMLGLELELPLTASPARAQHAAARARLSAAQLRYQARAEAIDAEVAQLHAQLQVGRERVQLSQALTDAARQLAEAERQRLQLGTATSTDVVQAQQADREAELRALRVRVDQARATLQLDHLVGALLVRHAVALQEVVR